MRLHSCCLLMLASSLLVTRPAYAGTQLFFPHIADGGGYRTTLLLSNRTSTPTIATIAFSTSSGAPWKIAAAENASSSHQVLLPAMGSAKLETLGLTPEVQTGWAKVTTSPDTSINGNAVFQLFRDSTLFAEACVPNAPPTTFADFYADEDEGFMTGFAMANPGTVTAKGMLTLIDKQGMNAQSVNISVPAGEQSAAFLFQIFAHTPSGRAEISLTEGVLSITALRFHISSVFSTVVVGHRSVFVSGSCSDIQEAITALPSDGGQVIIESGAYTCNAPIIIDRDNVDLRGQGPGTILRLAHDANSPVLILGQTDVTPSVVHRNIRISDLLIDGNRLNQAVECWGGPCDTGGFTHIRNNGLALRKVENVRIEGIVVRSTRSGGLVTEKGCRRLMVRDFISSDNHFDGLAGYETEDSAFSGLNLYDNKAAGLSFDIGFNNNIISDTTITGNSKVGIFMRDSRDNVFEHLQIRGNGEHGIFLAQVDADSTKPASGNTFTGMVISNSVGAGIRVNDASCVNNLICACQFVGNRDGGISEAVPGLIKVCGNVIR